MKLFSLVAALVFLSMSSFAADKKASKTFSMDEIAKHNTAQSCYMTYKGKVYDFTKKLPIHKDKFIDIQAWCGKDMAQAFDTKNGRNTQHKAESIKKLDDFYIGDLK